MLQPPTPTNLPCHHPQVFPRAGPHRPQLGLLILAWKVGELSAPIQRGQGRGASGRRGEGIESQGSKGTKALEEGLNVKAWKGAPSEQISVQRTGREMRKGNEKEMPPRGAFQTQAQTTSLWQRSRRDRQAGSRAWVRNASPSPAASTKRLWPQLPSLGLSLLA